MLIYKHTVLKGAVSVKEWSVKVYTSKSKQTTMYTGEFRIGEVLMESLMTDSKSEIEHWIMRVNFKLK